MFFKFHKLYDKAKEPWRFLLILAIMSPFLIMINSDNIWFNLLGNLCLALLGLSRVQWRVKKINKEEVINEQK